MYAVRKQKISDLLRFFLYKKEIYQSDLPKLTGSSERSIIRQLQFLESNGLVKMVRVERPKKGESGRGRQIWEITFHGIVQMLAVDEREVNYTKEGKEYCKFVNPIRFDEIAEIHKDKWLIFQEWPFIAKDEKAKIMVQNNTEIFAGERFFNRTEVVDYTNDGKMKSSYTLPLPIQIEQWDASVHALHLEMPFRERALPGAFYTEDFTKFNWNVNEEDDTAHFWKYVIKNEKLCEFVKSQFMLNKKIQNILLDLEKWLFSEGS
jgi:hypothetical protein